MPGLADIFPAQATPEAKAQQAQERAAAQTPAAPATPAQATPVAPLVEDPTAWKPSVAHDPTTGHDLVRDADGGVFLQSGGTVKKFAPQEASNLLSNQFGEYHPADLQTVDAQRKQQLWERASFAEKSDFVARQTLKTIADGATAPVRLAAGLAYGAAGKVSPLEESLSGEALVEKLDRGIAQLNHAIGLTDENPDELARRSAENNRTLAQAAPGVNAAASVAGFVLGGELGGAARVASGVERGAATVAEGLGLSAERAAKLGKYASEIATGAGIGLTNNTDEAWINNEKLTAESQLHALGMGALWGAGGAAALDALAAGGRGASALARKAFGAARKVEGTTAALTDEAIAEATQTATGSKPGAGFAGKFRGYVDWMRDKLERAQAESTGAALEDVQKYGPLNQSKEANAARDLWKNRDEYIEQHGKDLHSALTDLHTSGEEVYGEARDAGLKREHVGRLLSDADHDAIMTARRTKLEELQNGYEGVLKASTKSESGRSLLGNGRAVADIKAAYEDAFDSLNAARKPEDVFLALDGFKRATQRVKVNAEQTARRATSGIEIEQAKARSQLMFDVSENARDFLTSDLFGKAADAQKAVNSQFNAMLDTDAYVRSKLMESTGRVSQGANFGAPRFELAPDRVANFVDGVGLLKNQRLESMLRDNIASRKQLAEAIVQGYDLTSSHAEQLKSTIDAANRALKSLDAANETVGTVNKVNSVMAAKAKEAGFGTQGAVIATLLGHAVAHAPGGYIAGKLASKVAHYVLEPAKMLETMSKLRGATEGVGERVKSAVEGALAVGEKVGKPAAKAVKVGALESNERRTQKFAAVARTLSTMQSDPARAIEAVGELTGHITHPGVQSAATTQALTGLQFLTQKLPASLYQDGSARADSLANVSATKRDEFLAYTAAVENPAQFFSDLREGVATPQQAEVAQALMPQHFAMAQQQAVQTLTSGKVAAPFQQRLRVQRLLRVEVEPSARSGLQSFVAAQSGVASQQAAQAQAAQQRAGSAGSPSAASSLKSSLDTNKLLSH